MSGLTRRHVLLATAAAAASSALAPSAMAKTVAAPAVDLKALAADPHFENLIFWFSLDFMVDDFKRDAKVTAVRNWKGYCDWELDKIADFKLPKGLTVGHLDHPAMEAALIEVHGEYSGKFMEAQEFARFLRKDLGARNEDLLIDVQAGIAKRGLAITQSFLDTLPRRNYPKNRPWAVEAIERKIDDHEAVLTRAGVVSEQPDALRAQLLSYVKALNSGVRKGRAPRAEPT